MRRMQQSKSYIVFWEAPITIVVGAFLNFNENPTVIFGDNYGLIIGKFSELFHYIKITMVYARFKMLCIVLVFSTIFCEVTRYMFGH